MTARTEIGSEISPAALASTRGELIRRSLTCYVLGWLSLVPWLGLPVGLLVLILSASAAKTSRQVWNPARGYLVAARVMACVGCTLSLLSLLGVAAGAWLSSI